MAALPRAHVGQMIGLLEVLEDFGSKVDAAKVADDMMLELDDLLPALDAAKLLGFLKLDSGDLILTDEGESFLAKGSSGHKKLLNQALSRLGTFKMIVDYLRKQRNKEAAKHELVHFLRKEMPDLDIESAFHWIVEWGRYSLILRYDSNTRKIRLT